MRRLVGEYTLQQSPRHEQWTGTRVTGYLHAGVEKPESSQNKWYVRMRVGGVLFCLFSSLLICVCVCANKKKPKVKIKIK